MAVLAGQMPFSGTDQLPSLDALAGGTWPKCGLFGLGRFWYGASGRSHWTYFEATSERNESKEAPVHKRVARGEDLLPRPDVGDADPILRDL
jgi:hypothetical protein